MLNEFDPHELNYIQSRADINQDIVHEYSKQMKSGVIFDPVEAIQDESGKIHVWDGSHRGAASKLARKKIKAIVKKGTFEEATWLSLTANQRHGLQRTSADKRHIIKLALIHKKGYEKSNREIAKHVGVSDKTVASVRKKLVLSAEIPHTNTITIKRNGATYTQKKDKNLTIDEITIIIKNYLSAAKDMTALKIIKKAIKYNCGDYYIDDLMAMEGKKQKKDVIHAFKYLKIEKDFNFDAKKYPLPTPLFYYTFNNNYYKGIRPFLCEFCKNIFEPDIGRHYKVKFYEVEEVKKQSKEFIIKCCHGCKNNLEKYFSLY